MAYSKQFADSIDKLGFDIEDSKKQKHRVDVKKLGVGKYEKGKIKPDKKNNAIWFYITVDGKEINGDGVYGYVDMPEKKQKLKDGVDITKEEFNEEDFDIITDDPIEIVKQAISETIKEQVK